MKRLKIYIIIFCIALSIPLAYLILRTYQGLKQEEVSKLQYFAETIFDEMEKELTAIVLKEEARAIDEYNFKSILSSPVSGATQSVPSPLSRLPQEDYILGYFQNNPDGSFQTPLVEIGKSIPGDRTAVISKLKDTNRIFNRKRLAVVDAVTVAQTNVPITREQKEGSGFADQYLDLSESQKPKSYLGRKQKRVEKITIAQALNIAPQDRDHILKKKRNGVESGSDRSGYRQDKDQPAEESLDATLKNEMPLYVGSEKKILPASSRQTEKYQVEVAPLRSVFINTDQVFIFRRIIIDNQIYRQGFIIQVRAFLNHLAKMYFVKQPLARFTNLSLKVENQGHEPVLLPRA